MRPVIPNRGDRLRPRPHDPVAYRDRNQVERLFARAKQFRASATRYDKLGRCYLATVRLVLGFVCLRGAVNTA